MREEKIRVAIVGCGNIATRYSEQIQSYRNVEIIGFSDLQRERAVAFSKQYGGRVYDSLEVLLADPSVDAVVNLTIHHAHPEVIRQSLQAGKHVHTEKPLAMSFPEAESLVALAREKGLRLSSAPITYMGEAQQTAWKVIREGRCGKIRLAYAEVNHSRIETWHPNPEPFYAVGVLWDVAVYPLTLLTTFFGRAERVMAMGRVIYPDRVTAEGKRFHLETPDFVLAAIEFENGLLARLTANFYARGSKQGGSLEFIGDRGRVYLDSFQSFKAPVEFGEFGENYETVPFLREPFDGIEFGRGVEDLAEAIIADRPQRATGEQAAHVVEIVCALNQSIASGKPADLRSAFTPPPPMDWAG